MSKRLTKIKFHSIARDIKDGRRSVAEMAEFHHVSGQTIRAVKRTRTWPAFVLAKQQRMSYIANAKDQKFHDAQKAGLNPVRRAAAPKLTPNEQRLQDELDQLGCFITREEFDLRINEVYARLDWHIANLVSEKKRRTWPWGRR